MRHHLPAVRVPPHVIPDLILNSLDNSNYFCPHPNPHGNTPVMYQNVERKPARSKLRPCPKTLPPYRTTASSMAALAPFT